MKSVPTAISLEMPAIDGCVASEPRGVPRTASHAQSHSEAIYWMADPIHVFTQIPTLEQTDPSTEISLTLMSDRKSGEELSVLMALAVTLHSRRGMSLGVSLHVVAPVDLNLPGVNRWVVAR